MSDRPTARVDLHMHTIASDGEDTPEVLADRCAEAGLATVALTDHNSTANVGRMTERCATHGIEVIPACEVSTRWHGREHHCLAYWVPLDDPVFAQQIEQVRQADLARSRRWVENAAADGIPITWKEVEARVGVDRVPPFAFLAQQLLAAAADDPRFQSYDGNRGRLFGDWFAIGKPWATEPPWQPELPEAIAWIRATGAVPVLAHPGASLGDHDPAESFAELEAQGLAGVEAWTTWHRPDASERFDALARKAGLAVTAGSDYHGPTVKAFVRSPGQVEHNGPEVVEALERIRDRG